MTAKKKYQRLHSDNSTASIGVLITNLGTPDAPTAKALRRYLREFLSDPRVVEIPRLVWWFILNVIILPFRSKRSAELYSSIWTNQGSPLLLHTQAQAQALSNRLKVAWGDKLIVDFAMRYGAHSISEKIDNLGSQGVNKGLVLPLYPQYSATTTASTFDALAENFKRRRWQPELRFINSYYAFPAYIDAIENQIKQWRDTHGSSDKLILSYHGLPQRFVDNGDPYYQHCLKTSELIIKALKLEEKNCMTTFQSRFGKAKWLQPYTSETLKLLAAQGVKSVQVFCPGFSADCLETLEEIAHENKHYFMDAGGSSYQYIPALNSSDKHILALSQLISNNLQGW